MKSKLLLFLLLPLLMAAQNRTMVRGRVLNGTLGIKGVLVINNSSHTETHTDSLGFFSSKAAEGDLFVLSSYKVKPITVQYTKNNLQNNVFIINAEVTVTELEEVIINKDKNISAEALGIIPKGQAVYTNAERRVETQAKVKVFTDTMNSNPNTTIQTDALINRLTGRREALKRSLEAERKEGIIKNLNELYTKDDIILQYKIPGEYVNGFIFYVAEDAGIAQYINFKNNLGLKDRLHQLAFTYLDIIENEK